MGLHSPTYAVWTSAAVCTSVCTSPSPVLRRAHRAPHLTLTSAATCTPGPSPHPHLCSNVHTGPFTCAVMCTPGPSPRRPHRAPHFTLTSTAAGTSGTSPSPVQRCAHRALHLCSDMYTGPLASTCTPGPSPHPFPSV